MTNKEKQEADQDQRRDDWGRGEHGERARAKIDAYQKKVGLAIRKSLHIK